MFCGFTHCSGQACQSSSWFTCECSHVLCAGLFCMVRYGVLL